MAMSFYLRENIDFASSETPSEPVSSTEIKFKDVHICSAKLQIPQFTDLFERPRLLQLLEKNSKQFGATLVTGRAGTGKTALASDFAKNYDEVAWYSVGATDWSWKVFSGHFQASFNESRLTLKTGENFDGDETAIAQFFDNLFSRLNIIGKKKPLLIVLDDIHHIYDSVWFDSFFKSLLYSITADTHLLISSRSQPPVPLWRLRSKQVLGVIDEKLLALNYEETEDLLLKYDFSKAEIEKLHKETFGRISKLKLEK